MDGVRLGGLWRTRNGKGFSGPLGMGRLLILPNDYKRNDRDPDYVAFIVPGERSGGRAPTGESNDTRADEAGEELAGGSKDIPF